MKKLLAILALATALLTAPAMAYDAPQHTQSKGWS